MRLQYKVSLFLMVLSQVVFLGLAAYNTDNKVYYSNDDPLTTPSVGYSWIWYHPEQYIISLALNLAAVATFILGIIKEKNWKLSDFIKIEIMETEEDS